MSVFDELIFDRNQTDLSNNTAKAYHNVSDLERINGACLELSALFISKGISNTVTVDNLWGPLDYTPARLNQILQNIQTLRDLAVLGPTTPEVPDDFNRPTIEMANDLERILFDVYLYASSL